MKLYAIGLLPLTQKLKDTSDFVKQEWEIFQNEVDCLLDTYIDVESFRDEQSPNWSQFWYADDASCISNLYLVLFWMKLLFVRVQSLAIIQNLTKVMWLLLLNLWKRQIYCSRHMESQLWKEVEFLEDLWEINLKLMNGEKIKLKLGSNLFRSSLMWH